MKTMSAAEANRHFSSLLKDVARGEEILVLSRGRAVAKVLPFDSDISERKSAREALLSRLSTQLPTGRRNWKRDELYE
jgi:prevent-host-death family protein